jgi:hypothetical protein
MRTPARFPAPPKSGPRRRHAGLDPRRSPIGTLLLTLVLLLSHALTPRVSAASRPLAEDRPVDRSRELWSLKPLVRPEVPARTGTTHSSHPIDAFLAETAAATGLHPLGPADKATWLRRVTLDLVGLPPSPQEQQAFLTDTSERAAETVIDRLLASEQHGVRYGRHWLDVLRYTDVDEDMPAAPGIHFWRDWVIDAINRDLPYDQFVRAQVLGNRAAKRRIISAAGHLTPVEPRPEDLFALGFLARGATGRADADQELAFSAVETISTAFLGMTVGCARCHNHFFDPIEQAEFYSMKSLFDPLVLRPVELATPEQIFAHGRKVDEHETRLNRLVEAMRAFIKPHHDRLYEERLNSFPADVQAAIRKPEEQRSAAEKKLHDDYYPILRIDPIKLKAVMTAEEIARYDAFLKQIEQEKSPEPLPVFWTVAEDPKRSAETNYVLTTGDPKRPKKNRPVGPGFPFAPRDLDFHTGRRETFVDWLTSPANPLFARVAVNRVWAWHFGSGLHASTSDFGTLGGSPIHPKLLDWLASEFIAHGYSLKWLHRTIVTSEAYGRASTGSPDQLAANAKLDPPNRNLWRFPLRRLEAEPLRDCLLAVSGKLDSRLGGKSFDGTKPGPDSNRRGTYMARGYRTSADLMPEYLQTFDAEDGRFVCTRRTPTETAPQALFLMNSEFAETAASQLGEILLSTASGDLSKAVFEGFTRSLGRPPSDTEHSRMLAYLEGDPGRLRGMAWLLFNLDEFVYVR